jgi:hypothetical protein
MKLERLGLGKKIKIIGSIHIARESRGPGKKVDEFFSFFNSQNFFLGASALFGDLGDSANYYYFP